MSGRWQHVAEVQRAGSGLLNFQAYASKSGIPGGDLIDGKAYVTSRLDGLE